MINIAFFGVCVCLSVWVSVYKCLRFSSRLFVDTLIGKTEYASCNQSVVQTAKPERIWDGKNERRRKKCVIGIEWNEKSETKWWKKSNNQQIWNILCRIHKYLQTFIIALKSAYIWEMCRNSERNMMQNKNRIANDDTLLFLFALFSLCVCVTYWDR